MEIFEKLTESINYEKHDSSDSDDDDDVIIDNNSNDDHLKFDNHIGKDCPFTLIGQYPNPNPNIKALLEGSLLKKDNLSYLLQPPKVSNKELGEFDELEGDGESYDYQPLGEGSAGEDSSLGGSFFGAKSLEKDLFGQNSLSNKSGVGGGFGFGSSSGNNDDYQDY
ncbi:hypothetical protein TYRP_012792 [Tyrophagus putrescentiae]|nr:hypothetical protein TYRP_012792 [Tyrophagus putrescentiae]